MCYLQNKNVVYNKINISLNLLNLKIVQLSNNFKLLQTYVTICVITDVNVNLELLLFIKLTILYLIMTV